MFSPHTFWLCVDGWRQGPFDVSLILGSVVVLRSFVVVLVLLEQEGLGTRSPADVFGAAMDVLDHEHAVADGKESGKQSVEHVEAEDDGRRLAPVMQEPSGSTPELRSPLPGVVELREQLFRSNCTTSFVVPVTANLSHKLSGEGGLSPTEILESLVSVHEFVRVDASSGEVRMVGEIFPLTV